MDFDKYKMRFNAKSLCMFEKMKNKSFFKIVDEDDVLCLTYCMLISNNEDLLMTFEVFKQMMKDKKVSRWVREEYERVGQFEEQLRTKSEDGKEGSDDSDTEELTVTKMASSLIIQYGMDPDYVMYRMGVWEIYDYFKAAEAKMKDELIDKRLWTYLLVSPHVDMKKMKSPEKMLPFPWEKDERKKKAEEDLKKNLPAMQKIIGQKLNI